MPEILRTFMNIFDDASQSEVVTKAVRRIVIPKIQRDFAQGRNTDEICRVRERFLDALYKAVTTDEKIKLDFVYGDLSDDGILTPLDGQQRLTTLFLLHRYAAWKEHVPPEEFAFLKNFSYDTRPDSREFCKFLIDAEVNFNAESLSAELEDNENFPLGWKKDPTVSSMLVMLDAIDKKFRGAENLWNKLKDGAISFYFLSIEDMGLTDELYITMNSRGKPLTDFEHFKAEFKRRLDEIDRELSDRIILKIDTVWTDLLWTYRDANNLVDDGFLAYFGFLCDVILYKHDDTPFNKSRDPFDLLDEFFGGDVRANVDFMEKSFDCWFELAKREKISKFFDDRVSVGSRNDKTANHHAAGKIITYFDDADFFGDRVKSYNKNFSLGKVVMLYAFQTYLLNAEKISDADFRRRIRIVNNLVTNSGDAELSNSTARNNGNRIPAMLEQVDNIIINGEISDTKKLAAANKYNFNEIQLAEEREKLSWTQANSDKAESLFELEDHYLLYGRIGIIGLERPEYFSRFISLFACDYDKISCALLACGDYYQVDNNGWRYQLGSTRPQSWQNLFHKSALVKRFDETRKFLNELLSRAQTFTDEYLQRIIDEHLAECEKNSSFKWTYYFIKYADFRPPRYGKYRWENFSAAPYCLAAMWMEQKMSTNSYQPFLKALGVGELDRDDLGMRLVFDGGYYVTCENDAYVVKNSATGTIEDRLPITQRNGVDSEDRIQKFKRWETLSLLKNL